MRPTAGPPPDGPARGPEFQDPSQVGPVASSSTAVAPQDHPLRALCNVWVEKIRIAERHKMNVFGKDAQECVQFFNGPYDFMYKRAHYDKGGTLSYGGDVDDDEFPAPTFQMTVNKVAELVQIFGPALYHKNPIRQVNPRTIPDLPAELWGDPADPMASMQLMQAQAQNAANRTADRVRADLLQAYLNYTPTELDLKTHSRRAINEALIKGCSCLWTELYQPPGADFRLVGSFMDTVDNLQVDPDGDCFEDAKWIARRCVHPVWQVEMEYGLPPDSLKGVAESAGRQAEVNTAPDGDWDRTRGRSNDLVVYWKVFSRMGMGGRLQGAPQELRSVLEQFGDYAYLVVCSGVPYPLNLPPGIQAQAGAGAQEDILSRLDWPTPFWADDDWPVTRVYFHEVPRSVWPMSHFKPALGELKFLNWAYSFLVSKIRISCRDFIAMPKSAGEELKTAILHGRDLTLLEIEQAHGTVTDVVNFIHHPQMNGDIWKVIEAVTDTFEKRTGMTELVYGMSAASYRSAEEANVKGQQLAVRPDDMAQMVEDQMTAVARKEAMVARWHLQPQDVVRPLGPVNAMWWQKFVSSADFYALMHQLEYRIEAGSAKKPNRARDLQNMKDAMTALQAPLFTYAKTTGDVKPFNALIAAWAKAIDLDATNFMLQPPPPPPPPLPPGAPPPGGPGVAQGGPGPGEGE